MTKKSALAAVLCAAVIGGTGAGAAFAGEVTGSGKNSDQNQGRSWCSFSGHNDDPSAPIAPPGPDNPNGPGGTSQSYGQDVRYGLADPSGDKVTHPGTQCNPNKTTFGPQPNRDPGKKA
jgi:hypothetical protein